jgi:hypothetical protein
VNSEAWARVKHCRIFTKPYSKKWVFSASVNLYAGLWTVLDMVDSTLGYPCSQVFFILGFRMDNYGDEDSSMFVSQQYNG